MFASNAVIFLKSDISFVI